MRKLLLGLVVASFIAVVFSTAGATPTPAPAEADESCDPYPIGRCGAHQRETVKWCYYPIPNPGSARNPLLVDATDHRVVTAGPTTPGVVSLDGGVPGAVYVRKSPFEAVVEDPWEAPLPTGTVYQETNLWTGLQTKASRCSDFIWFAECEPPQWMWFTSVPLPADKLLA